MTADSLENVSLKHFLRVPNSSFGTADTNEHHTVKHSPRPLHRQRFHRRISHKQPLTGTSGRLPALLLLRQPPALFLIVARAPGVSIPGATMEASRVVDGLAGSFCPEVPGQPDCARGIVGNLLHRFFDVVF